MELEMLEVHSNLNGLYVFRFRLGVLTQFSIELPQIWQYEPFSLVK